MGTAARQPLAELRGGWLARYRPPRPGSVARPSPVRALAYLGAAAGGVGLYLPVWLTSRPDTWPLVAGTWALVYGLAATAIGALALLGRARLLLRLTVLGGALLLAATALLGGAAPAYAALAWLALIAFGLGDDVLGRLAPRGERGAELDVERVAVSLLLGFGTIALATAGLGAIGWLHPPATVATLLVLSVPLLRQRSTLLHEARRLADRARARWSARNEPVPAVGLASLVLCFAGSLVWAIAPSVHFDAQMYHLPIAEADAARHRSVELPYYAMWRLIGLAHTLYALAFVLGDQPLPTLLHFAFGLITTALVSALARQLAGPIAGWVAAILFASMPLVSWEAGTAYIDLFVTGYTFGCLYALLRWWADEDAPDGWLVVAGLSGGMAIGTKLNAALLLVPAVAFGVLAVAVRRRRLRASLPGWVGLLVPLALVPLPWFARNWWVIAERVSPFFRQVSEGTGLEQEAIWARFGRGSGPLDFLRLPYDLVVHGPAFDEIGFGAPGIVPLLALLAPFAGRSVPWRVRGPMLALSLATLVLWFRAVQVSRYLLPLLPLLAVLAVLPLPAVLRAIVARPCLARRAWAGLLVVGLTYLVATRGMTTYWGFQLVEAYPIKLALGLESRDEFLDRALPPYRAFQFLNAQAGSSGRVLSAGAPFQLYLDRGLEDDVHSPEARRLARMPADASLARELIDRGYEFILVHWGRIRYQQRVLPYIDQQFLRRFTTLEFAHRDVYVYRLAGAAGRPNGAGPDLLTNGDFDAPDAVGTPPAWEVFGAPRVERDPAAARSAPTSVLVTYEDGLAQRFAASPGRLYTVRLWARAAASEQSVRPQIRWLDAELRPLDTSHTNLPVTVEWQPLEASFTALDRRTAFGVVDARASRRSQVRIDDVSLVEGW